MKFFSFSFSLNYIWHLGGKKREIFSTCYSLEAHFWNKFSFACFSSFFFHLSKCFLPCHLGTRKKKVLVLCYSFFFFFFFLFGRPLGIFPPTPPLLPIRNHFNMKTVKKKLFIFVKIKEWKSFLPFLFAKNIKIKSVPSESMVASFFEHLRRLFLWFE